MAPEDNPADEVQPTREEWEAYEAGRPKADRDWLLAQGWQAGRRGNNLGRPIFDLAGRSAWEPHQAGDLLRLWDGERGGRALRLYAEWSPAGDLEVFIAWNGYGVPVLWRPTRTQVLALVAALTP